MAALFDDPAGRQIDSDLAGIGAAVAELPSVAALWGELEPERRAAWECTWRELMGRLDEAGCALFGARAPMRRLVAYRRALEALDEIAPLVDALGLHRPRALL